MTFFDLKTEINATFSKNNIKIDSIDCTKIRCDSDFSNMSSVMLSLLKSYSFKKNTTKLNVPGWGWINLKLY